MKEKLKMSSSVEMNERKAMQVFGIAVISLVYLWSFAYAISIILQAEFDDILFYIQIFIYLLVLVSLGLLIPIVVYEAKRIRTSSKESIVNFAVILITSLVILVYSTMQFVAILKIFRQGGPHVVSPKNNFIIMAAMLLAISYNSVFIKKAHLSDSQKASQSITTCFAILLGLMIIPVIYGMFQFWVKKLWETAFISCILGLEIVIFQLLCIALIIKLVHFCINKQEKQIILWSVMLVFALMFTIFTINYQNHSFDWITPSQNGLMLIISSIYMITTSILFLCLNKNERQITR